jgi:hypothetical protein
MCNASWSAYYGILQRSVRSRHGFDALFAFSGSYLETLTRLRPLLRVPFTELSREDMKKVVGYEVQGYDYGWFGSIRSSGQAWHQLLHNDELREFLRHAMSRVEGAESNTVALEVAQEVFERCVAIPMVGHATPTRLLVIYRPDLFFSVNRNSVRRLSVRFGITQTKLKTWHGYGQALRRVWQERWYLSQRPCENNEQRAWDARVALLDAYCYEGESA